LNKHIIFESVLMLLTKNYQNSPCLSKVQIVEVSTLFETHCMFLSRTASMPNDGMLLKFG